MEWNKSTGGKKIIEMWSNRQWQMGWSDGQWLMRGEEFGGCVLMTSSLLLEKRLSSFLLHRHVTAVILWHFKLYTLEAQIQLAQGTCHSLLAVFQLGEGFFPQKLWVKTTGCVCRVRETNTKWHQIKVMDKGCLYLYKGKSRVTVFLWIFFHLRWIKAHQENIWGLYKVLEWLKMSPMNWKQWQPVTQMHAGAANWRKWAADTFEHHNTLSMDYCVGLCSEKMPKTCGMIV